MTAAAFLTDLKATTDRCRECPIGAHATQSVVGEGSARARLMLVGEQPGDQEDLQGRPFVGPAGRQLDQALAELGWPRDAVFITNAVKHFKFELRGKRRIHKSPAQQEIAACLHWLEDEIAAVQHPGDARPVLITLHPSALLRLRGPDREAAYARWLDDLRPAQRHLR